MPQKNCLTSPLNSDLHALLAAEERLGAHKLAGLRNDTIREVRGRGLMIAVELHSEAGGARAYCERLRQRGLLAKDTHGHTIRITPPLLITREQVDWACEVFAEALGGSGDQP